MAEVTGKWAVAVVDTIMDGAVGEGTVKAGHTAGTITEAVGESQIKRVAKTGGLFFCSIS